MRELKTRMGNKSLSSFHRDEQGQIIYLTVVSVVVFVALAALIINSGHMVTRKMETQNAVDAAAVSSAAWIARGMNVISMNNVAMTELLALTVVLRALKETWEEGAETASKIVAVGTEACVAVNIVPVVGQVISAACAAYLASVEASLTYFEGKLALFGWLIASATDPNGGALWQVMQALSLVNAFVAVDFPVLALEEAGRLGRINKADGVLVPPLPLPMPVEEGQFSDLCHPTRVGSPSSYPQALRRGYVPLLGEPYDAYDKGPLLVYRDMANGFLLQLAFLPLLQDSPLAGKTDQEFRKVCESSGLDSEFSSGSKPRPMLLRGRRHSTNSSLAGLDAVKKELNYLGIAWRQSESLFMPTRFTNPRKRICTYGQGRVFNGTSFDLFTQDWRAKLVKADMLDEGIAPLLLLASQCEQLEELFGAPLLNSH